METGFIVKWGKLVPGREQQAIELFGETKAFFIHQLTAGIITYYEPFIYASGDWETEAGFWVVKGDRDQLWKMVETEGFRWLMTRAQFVVDHLRFEWLLTDELLTQQVERATKAAGEFVFVH
jgi:hypothetical protein